MYAVSASPTRRRESPVRAFSRTLRTASCSRSSRYSARVRKRSGSSRLRDVASTPDAGAERLVAAPSGFAPSELVSSVPARTGPSSVNRSASRSSELRRVSASVSAVVATWTSSWARSRSTIAAWDDRSSASRVGVDSPDDCAGEARPESAVSEASDAPEEWGGLETPLASAASEAPVGATCRLLSRDPTSPRTGCPNSRAVCTSARLRTPRSSVMRSAEGGLPGGKPPEGEPPDGEPPDGEPPDGEPFERELSAWSSVVDIEPLLPAPAFQNQRSRISVPESAFQNQ